MNKAIRLATGLCLLAGVGGAHAASISLFDWGYNIDGTPYDSDPEIYAAPGDGLSSTLPSGIDDSGFGYSNGFDTTGGIGTIVINVTAALAGPGAHTVGVYFDHELDEAADTFYDESGAASGTPAAGQHWEIDSPGATVPGLSYTGDIIENFFFPLNAGNLPELDDQAFHDALAVGAEQDLATAPCDDLELGSPGCGTGDGPVDVAMAMSWDFVLGVGQKAVIEFTVSESLPASGFYLSQSDPLGTTIYLSSTLGIFDVTSTPEPASALLVAGGLLLLARRRRQTG